METTLCFANITSTHSEEEGWTSQAIRVISPSRFGRRSPLASEVLRPCGQRLSNPTALTGLSCFQDTGQETRGGVPLGLDAQACVNTWCVHWSMHCVGVRVTQRPHNCMGPRAAAPVAGSTGYNPGVHLCTHMCEDMGAHMCECLCRCAWVWVRCVHGVNTCEGRLCKCECVLCAECVVSVRVCVCTLVCARGVDGKGDSGGSRQSHSYSAQLHLQC